MTQSLPNNSISKVVQKYSTDNIKTQISSSLVSKGLPFGVIPPPPLLPSAVEQRLIQEHVQAELEAIEPKDNHKLKR